MEFNFRGSALKLLQSTHPCGLESRQQKDRSGKRDFFTASELFGDDPFISWKACFLSTTEKIDVKDLGYSRQSFF